jgi:hypothetical protein
MSEGLTAFIGVGAGRARGQTDPAWGRARERVGQALICRQGSNTCKRYFCPSSGACSHSSGPALALVNAQDLFPFPQATDLVWWTRDFVDWIQRYGAVKWDLSHSPNSRQTSSFVASNF